MIKLGDVVRLMASEKNHETGETILWFRSTAQLELSIVGFKPEEFEGKVFRVTLEEVAILARGADHA